ncbi:MAG: ceramidase domain-containing protein [Marinicellaceae bacterium]
MSKIKIANIFMTIIVFVSVAVIFFIDPIPQDLEYHKFVDSKNIFGIPNFWNVASNLPFLFIGIYALSQFKYLNIIQEIKLSYWLFFFAVAMVAFGSGYYHYDPNNISLVWDRLPMTLAFMSLFSIIISEFISVRKGQVLLWPLLIIGLFSVLYWLWTESNGVGDLRFYVLVQFLPIIFIPIILVCYTTRFNNIVGYWLLLVAYIIAKVLEYFDWQLFELSFGYISGHAVKHIMAAIGVYFLYINYKNRSLRKDDS